LAFKLYTLTIIIYLNEYAAFVAHQLRNPLSTIRLTAEMLLSETKDPNIREYATSIIAEADEMTKKIENSLDVDKTEAEMTKKSLQSS
jgi:signal transduction histidine kinase